MQTLKERYKLQKMLVLTSIKGLSVKEASLSVDLSYGEAVEMIDTYYNPKHKVCKRLVFQCGVCMKIEPSNKQGKYCSECVSKYKYSELSNMLWLNKVKERALEKRG